MRPQPALCCRGAAAGPPHLIDPTRKEKAAWLSRRIGAGRSGVAMARPQPMSVSARQRRRLRGPRRKVGQKARVITLAWPWRRGRRAAHWPAGTSVRPLSERARAMPRQLPVHRAKRWANLATQQHAPRTAPQPTYDVRRLALASPASRSFPLPPLHPHHDHTRRGSTRRSWGLRDEHRTGLGASRAAAPRAAPRSVTTQVESIILRMQTDVSLPCHSLHLQRRGLGRTRVLIISGARGAGEDVFTARQGKVVTVKTTAPVPVCLATNG